MSVGERHVFSDGYAFVETLHGPNVEHVCVDCGEHCYGIPECTAPRCGACLLTWAGMSIEERRTLQEHPPQYIGSPPTAQR